MVKVCKDNENTLYDMVFLVPPSLVVKEMKKSKFGDNTNISSFKLIQDFEKKQIKIWDGTNAELRTEYPVILEEHRLFQYDSCRGLEGWVVVCLDLDDFMNYKYEIFKEEEIHEGEQLTLGVSFEQNQSKFVRLWTLIPLTRAIDTLVITIKNKSGVLGEVLKEIYHENPDTIEWVE